MDGILIAVLIIGGAGLIIGILLGIAGKIFEVSVDEKEIQIREALPGNNCGGCGYAGCDALAKAIASGEAAPNACPVGGNACAGAIGEILGVEVKAVKKTAFVKCSGTCEKASSKYNYYGSDSCKEAMALYGGAKNCKFGCLGLGSCAKACDYNAIIIKDGIASVDREKCVACGKCAKACPKNLIDIIPYENIHAVACNSTDKGKATREVCGTGCIGCMKCVRNCPVDAISVTDNLAKIDYDKCVVCIACSELCPSKCIR